MSNMTCEEMRREFNFELEGQPPTLMDLWIKLNKIERENEILKANNYELKKENLQLRNDNNELHNKINENTDDIGMLNEYEEEYLCGCESEEDLKAYEEALNNCSIKK